jgi:shikimate dehydrogenase
MDKESPARIYGVLGYPAKHSLSPAMHNAAFQALKINAEYRIFEKKPEELESFIRSLPEENIYGLNVTVPYKEKVIPLLDGVSQEAELIGAVNTIKVSQRKREGFNTDGEGFLNHLSVDLGFNPKDKNIAIIGAGGAAKAISVYLSRKKPKSIALYDIDRQRLSALVRQLKENFNHIEFMQADSLAGLEIRDRDLLVNATPIGMKDSDPCLIEEEMLHERLLVYDLVYNPPQTKLLALAEKVGARTANGLGMLLYQGARSFELWTGEKAPLEIMREELSKGVKNLCSGKS